MSGPGSAVGSALGVYFAMGGYGVFVWPAYAVAFAVLGGLGLWSWMRHRRARRSLARLQSDGA
jgi:heme exporter protein CcmD